MTLYYNDNRVEIKTGIWDRAEIDIYNNEYYSYNSYYIEDDDDDNDNNNLNDDKENIKVKVRIKIKVIIRVKLKVNKNI